MTSAGANPRSKIGIVVQYPTTAQIAHQRICQATDNVSPPLSKGGQGGSPAMCSVDSTLEAERCALLPRARQAAATSPTGAVTAAANNPRTPSKSHVDDTHAFSRSA